MARLAIVAGVALIAACVPVESDSETAASPLATDQSQPLLALADHVLADYFTRDIANRPTVCIAYVGEGGLAPVEAAQELALMEQYSALAPRARCESSDVGWRDSSTGEPALVFALQNLSCSSETQCEAYASYRAGNSTSPVDRYSLAWSGSAWAITRHDMRIADEPDAAAAQ